jgi:hypothetical protein
VTHTDVIFGQRLTAKDLMNLDSDPQAQNPTQYQDLIRRKMITKFGSMKMPVPLNALLALDTIDRDDLGTASDKFLQISRGDRTSEMRENHQVKLYFGFEIDGTIYDVVQFGNRTTGKDEVEADASNLQGISRACFLIGKQISRLSTADGLASIDGQVDLETFQSLDGEDLNLLRIGAEMWRISFRLKGKNVSRKRNGNDGTPSDAGNGNERKRDSKSAD